MKWTLVPFSAQLLNNRTTSFFVFFFLLLIVCLDYCSRTLTPLSLSSVRMSAQPPVEAIAYMVYGTSPSCNSAVSLFPTIGQLISYLRGPLSSFHFPKNQNSQQSTIQ